MSHWSQPHNLSPTRAHAPDFNKISRSVDKSYISKACGAYCSVHVMIQGPYTDKQVS